MLSDDSIEKLILPFLTRQQELNTYVVLLLARRIKELKTLLPSDVYKLEMLLKNGSDVVKINQEIARLTKMQEKEIRSIIRTVAEDAYIGVKPFYDYRSISYIPFEQNIELNRVIQAITKQTTATYLNMSKAQAFMLRDPISKKLVPTDISKTYYTVIDRAVQASQQSVMSYDEAIRDTMQQLNASGIRSVTYNPESGRIYTQRLDTAVRRNILDGIRAINQGVQDVVGEQFGADGKEITVHANSAPDHEPVQGHQFTNEEFEKLQNDEPFEDINGNKFNPIARPIGVLNCRHFTYSIIVGVTPPNYTQAQLDEMKRKNQKGYTTSKGKHLTLYECTQEQRKMETKIRKLRELYEMAKQADNAELTKTTRTKLSQALKDYTAFSKACGLKPKMQNTALKVPQII